MNGLILQTAPENKDIKFSKNLVKDTKSDESDNLFASLIENLIIEDELESKNGSFLLAKLLNLDSDVESKSKKFSFFSGGELLEEGEGLEATEESVLLEELFRAALAIKEGDDLQNFQTNSKLLKLSLEKDSTIEELKSAKNIKELIDIARKNGIKVKNFQFFKEEAALSIDDRKVVNRVINSEIFQTDKEKPQTIAIFQSSSKKQLSKTQNSQKESNILSKLLTRQTNKTSSTSEIKEEVEVLQNSDFKKSASDKTAQKRDIKNSNTQNIDTDVEVFNQKKSEAFIKDKELSKTDQLIDSDSIKKPNHTTPHHNTQHKKAENEVLKNLLNQQNGKKQETDVERLSNGENSIEKSASTKETLKNDENISTQNLNQKGEIETKKDLPQIRKSLNTFAAEFKEKVESYKAPLMKVKMQLTPQNLGEVDVTLINRGNTLHVNITSNTNSMALFMQNQNEFRNSLVNMGFSDLQMNFSDHKESRKEHNQKEKNSSSFEDFEDEKNDSIDITMPYYV
jgi:hypothetical protein